MPAAAQALDAAEEANGPIRAVVHCAGRGGDRVRILDRELSVPPLEETSALYQAILNGKVAKVVANALTSAPTSTAWAR